MIEVNEASVRLFSITQGDTLVGEDDVFENHGIDEEPLTAETYEANFRAAMLPWPDSQPFFEAIGWDISNGRGGELECAHFFARQIVALEGDLVEGVRFTPDGSGSWYCAEDDKILDSLTEERMAANLEREIAAFYRRQR